MDFENRFFNTLLFIIIATLLIGGLIVISIKYSQVKDDSVVLIVKPLPSIKATPKVNFIPVSARVSNKADISNSVVNSKTKQPVVINI